MAENGRIPLSELVAFQGSSETVYLRADAYQAWIKLQFQGDNDGMHVRVLEGYRDYATQVHLRALYLTGQGPPAGIPGTSSHGWGIAVDVANVGPFGSQKYNWLAEKAPLFGWSGTQGRADGEPWHWVFVKTGAAGSGESPFPEPPNPPGPFPRKKKNMIAYVLVDGAGKFGPVNKLRTYVIGGSYFEDTTDQPTANQVSVLVNGFFFNDDGSPFVPTSPNLTYKELYSKAVASRACSPEQLAAYKTAAGL